MTGDRARVGPDIGIIGATISPQSESMASPLVLLAISYYRHHHRPTCCTRSSDTDGTVDGLLPDNRTSHLQGLGIEDGSHHGKGSIPPTIIRQVRLSEGAGHVGHSPLRQSTSHLRWSRVACTSWHQTSDQHQKTPAPGQLYGTPHGEVEH